MYYFIIMRFKIGCVLSYEVLASSTFIFNISVEKNEYQNILEEELRVLPKLPIDEFSAKKNLTRSHMLFAEQGELEITYKAEVEISNMVHKVEDAVELHTTQLPFSVIEYLYPSRYCESDKLE
ncbi:MAG: transglutaminase family protein, partial [Thermodesulfobacteriota bacterium]